MKYYLGFCSLLFIFLNSCSTKQSEFSRFTQTQQEMIVSGSEKTPMRVYKITNKQDSLLLRSKSQPVSLKKDKALTKLLIERMITTMIDSVNMGVGIAAPQVGILKNVIIVQRFDKDKFPIEGYINPIITDYSKKTQTRKEGCLSIPDRSELLNSRAYAIVVEYDDIDGNHHTELIEDFTAIIFQHEIDHLNGILYLDHLQEEVANTNH